MGWRLERERRNGKDVGEVFDVSFGGGREDTRIFNKVGIAEGKVKD